MKPYLFLFFCFLGSALLPPSIILEAAEPTPSPETTLPSQKHFSYTDAVILGVVEGTTEYLPISSTGHLILISEALGLNEESTAHPTRAHKPLSSDQKFTQKEAINAYIIFIQSGAIAAVLVLYWNRFRQMGAGLLGGNRKGLLILRNLTIAFIPAGITGFLLHDWIEEKLFSPIPVVVALIAGAGLMFGVELWKKHRAKHQSTTTKGPEVHELSMRASLSIGLLQCVALWPGTSRSMMTLIGGYLVGLRPAQAAEFTFLLGFVTLSAAALYKSWQSGSAMVETLVIGPTLVGWLVAALSAGLAIKGLVYFLTRYGLKPFALYRICLAILVLTVI